jgi:outer membrane protein TolC
LSSSKTIQTQRSRAKCFLMSGALIGLLNLSACSSIDLNSELPAVEKIVSRTQEAPLVWITTEEQARWVEEQTLEKLKEPLTAERAVDVALLNNASLQARFAELGIGKAEMEQAGRLPNPGFSFGKFSSGQEREIERSLHLNLVRLALFGQYRKIEAQRLAQTRLAVANEVLVLSARTRRSFYETVAAAQTLEYAQQVLKAAQASSELARRMENAGNFGALQKAREQSFYADAVQANNRAGNQFKARQQQLLRLLGLPTQENRLKLPATLPELPAKLQSQNEVKAVGLSRRLDVQGAQIAAQRTADILGLTKATRFITIAELGGVYDSSSEGTNKKGYELSVELPIFDSGEARLARAEAIYRQALSRVKEVSLNANSELTEALNNYQAAFELAKYQRDEIVPLRQKVAQENLLRYNGMLIGVFELLAETRLQINSVTAYIELLRDFWIAETDLQLALTGKPVLALPSASGAASAALPHASPAAH